MTETLLENLLKKIQSNQSVLFLWQGVEVPTNFKETIDKIQALCGPDSKVNVEHTDRLQMSNHTKSTFDFILSNILTPALDRATTKSLVNYLSLLKPNGKFIEFGTEEKSLESELKLNGFTNVVVEKSGTFNSCYGEKPAFEVGASSKLKFSKKAEAKPAVWKFSANDVNEDDLIDTDDLLDDLDLKKPEVQVRDCGTGNDGKKKACKGCVCGLAEEIEAEAAGQIQKNQAPAAKSACGSCYLGDAFRCASCPYLGMPAFKAGEKIQISESLLKADI